MNNVMPDLKFIKAYFMTTAQKAEDSKCIHKFVECQGVQKFQVDVNDSNINLKINTQLVRMSIIITVANNKHIFYKYA